MKRARTIALMLALAALTARAEQMKFDAPRANGYRVDACRSWGQGCGKEAADAFCRLNNFESAAAFDIDPRIGAATPTMTIEDKKICNQPQCDGFKSITCTRSDAAPGRRRVPPSTQPEPSRPPHPLATFRTALTVPPPCRRLKPGAHDTNAVANSADTKSAPDTPAAPRSPVALARLDPAEFVIIKPKSSTATLGRFGASATFRNARRTAHGAAQDQRRPGADRCRGRRRRRPERAAAAGNANPLKPEKSELRFLKLAGDLTFAPIGEHGVFVGKGLPLLTTGRFVGGERSEQALVYAPGEGAAILAWRPGSATTAPVDYVIVEGGQPKGALDRSRRNR